jgi:hypothetical protein
MAGNTERSALDRCLQPGQVNDVQLAEASRRRDTLYTAYRALRVEMNSRCWTDNITAA